MGSIRLRTVTVEVCTVKVRCEVSPGQTSALPGNRARAAGGDDATAVRPTAGSHVDDVIGVGDQIEVVLDHKYRPALVEESLEDPDEHTDVIGVQSHVRLVVDKKRDLLSLVDIISMF